MRPEPIEEYAITPHAALQMERRGLSEEHVRSVLAAPEQRFDVRPGRVILHSRIPLGEPARTYLLRVFVDLDRAPPEVVTVYRTGKVAKYWEEEP